MAKAGIPTALIELGYPSEEWIAKHKKRNAIKVMFIQGSQMTYQGSDGKLVRMEKTGRTVEIIDHVKYMKSIPIKKRAQWVLVFRTPHDLHTFISIIESVTNPEAPISREQPTLTGLRSDSLERRNREYLKRQGIDVDRDEDANNDPRILEKNTHEEQLTDNEKRSRNIQKLKDKVFSQQL